MAAIGLCQLWAVRDAEAVTDQLQLALEGRVAIEQAKGMLAQRAAMGTDQAFSCLRTYARTIKRLLVEVVGAGVGRGRSVPTWCCRIRVAGRGVCRKAAKPGKVSESNARVLKHGALRHAAAGPLSQTQTAS